MKFSIQKYRFVQTPTTKEEDTFTSHGDDKKTRFRFLSRKNGKTNVRFRGMSKNKNRTFSIDMNRPYRIHKKNMSIQQLHRLLSRKKQR